MMKKERIELRVSKEEKQKIMSDALENNMSMTDYILRCVIAQRCCIKNNGIKLDNTKDIIECIMDLDDIASEKNDERSRRFLKRLGDLECLL
ncbi:hypothetical protein KEC48_12160 [Clostridium sp. C1]|uniref:plasmid mobilization protein n=1 Tax=Clostridium sp. C1 TaxID=1155388 RepID=UPI001BADA3B5|nr:hypothetical protein [Clostridium sp. C1]QUN12224.1 hypothetical protein KEC48_12160 [Clostridium sp. C1]